ncbi:SAM-dependent methyltransferase [Mucilaginibacter koreensis]
MPQADQSLPENYFNEVYHAHDDPWNFETSDYEREKYTATVNALPREKYENAFEIGCSIGVLSRMLADKCEKLLSVDVAEAPLVKARQRLQDKPQVTLQKMTVPNEFPEQEFDLVMMSEVGYYLSMPDLERLQQQIISHLKPGGQLMLVHWTPYVHDYPLTGDEVHESFLKLTGAGQPFKLLLQRREPNYRMELLERQ